MPSHPKLSRIALAGALCAAMLPAAAAAPDPFHGIYSVFDPVSGTQRDLLSVRPDFLAGYSLCANFDDKWSCVEAAALPGAPQEPAMFRQDASVKTLQAERLGFLMYAPRGATTRVGKTPTGYIAELATNAGYSINVLNRRPLTGGLLKERVLPRKETMSVQVRELNYTGEPIAVAIAPAAQPGQRVELDTVNPYGLTPRRCCASLPPNLAGGGDVIVTWRTLPDGTEQSAKATLPPRQELLWVVVHADRTAELVMTEERHRGPDDSDWPGKVKNAPEAPAAFRKAALAKEIGVRRQYLAGLVERRTAARAADAQRPAGAEPEYLHGEIGIDEMVRNERASLAFLEALAACDGDKEACLKGAQDAGRNAARQRE